MTYEVVWNGAHGDTDRDLLCCPLRLPKRRDVPIVGVEHRALVVSSRPARPLSPLAATIAAHLTEWRSVRELCARLSLTPMSIEAGLRRLRATGRLESARVPGVAPSFGLSKMRYRLRAEAA